MSRLWVLDASPLILLARIGQSRLVEELAPQYVVPDAVVEEILNGPAGDPAIGWLDQVEDRHIARRIAPRVEEWGLGSGESAAISYALQNPRFEVILDDAAGRACAASLGVRVRGTLGVLLLAKQARLILRVRPSLDALKEAGMWVDDALLRKALELAEEADG